MKPLKHLSCNLLQKKLTVYSLKQFHTQKKSTLNVCEAPKITILTLMNRTQNILRFDAEYQPRL